MANGANLPAGFVLDKPVQAAFGLPEGFVLDQPQNELQAAQVEPTAQTTPAQPDEDGLFDRIGAAFSGADRMTPQMETLPEIGRAPELNALSVPAFKASLGLLTTGETEPLKAILSQQFGKSVTFNSDEKGNVIVDLPSGQYALNKPGLSGQDIVRGVFDMAMFTPAARAASIPAAIGKSAATETVIEGVESGVGGNFTAKDIALAGGVGGAGKIVENVIGAGARIFKGDPKNALVEAGQDADIRILTSDIRQPKTFAEKTAQQISEKIPVLGTGGMRQSQQLSREALVNKVTEKYGEFSYSAIVDSLKSQKNRIKNAAGNVLNKVGNTLDKVGDIPLLKTNQAIQEVTAELSKKGVIKSTGAINDLKLIAETLNEIPQTFTTLKENRTAFSEIIKGADKAERTQLTSRAKALLTKVGKAMKSDMDSFAKANLSPLDFGKWQRANKVYANEANKLTKTKLKNILDKGDITPESVQNMLFSQKPSEVNALYKSLTTTGRANARSAIISKVVNNLGKRPSGITPNTFASEMGKFGLQTGQFFKGEQKKQLNGFLKVLNSTRRAQDAAIATPTGQQMIGIATGAAAAVNLPLTLGIAIPAGMMARLYESAPVRNALIRLGSIPKGSTEFDKALTETMQALTAGAQALRESNKEEPETSN